jgi:hypothetical protein
MMMEGVGGGASNGMERSEKVVGHRGKHPLTWSLTLHGWKTNGRPNKKPNLNLGSKKKQTNF